MSFNTISSAQARMLFIFPTQRSISLAFSSSVTPCFLAISFIRYSAISRAEVSISARCSYNFPLHKMYTFVYRTFIKFILFLPGTGTGCLGTGWFELLLYLAQMKDSDWEVSMPSWTWVVTFVIRRSVFKCKFQCPHGLELLLASPKEHLQAYTFQCPHGLELLHR